jgi:hydroxymethylbilane synthase
MFLQTLEGGCTAPIGAFAEIKDDKVYFTAAVFDIEGKEKIDITQNASLLKAQNLGTETANTILQKGGKELMEKIKRSLQKNE